LGVRGGGQGQAASLAPGVARLGPAQPILTRAELAQPANLGRLVDMAIRAAGLAWQPELADRVLAVLRQVQARQAAAPAPRVARLALELERQGLGSYLGRLEGFLARDGFGLDDQVPGAGGAQNGGEGGRRSPDDPGQARQDSPADQRGGLSETDSTAPQPFALELGRGKIPAGAWVWVSLPARAGNRGGGLRWRQLEAGQEIAMDILSDGGTWQFYWNEPQRDCLNYLPPESAAIILDESMLQKKLIHWLGDLDFGAFRKINDEDWVDGFNFLKSDSILGRVDMVV
jgi:hypothetical protein